MPNATQGLVSYTTSEITSLVSIYKAGGTSSAYKVEQSIVRSADKALLAKPVVYAHVTTSGDSAQGGGSSNTGATSQQSSQAYALAQAYEITGSSKYLTQAKNFILSWAKGNVPDGDSIANASLLDMFHAYDLVRGKFTTSERATADKWLTGIADALIADHNAAVKSGSVTAYNNHHSWDLLEVGTIGTVIGNTNFIHYATDNFLDHIGNNLRSIPGEPPYLGVDYDLRKAYHYVAFNLEALSDLAVLVDRVGHVAGNPYGIHYNPFTVEVNGASIAHTLDALLPYASGEKQSLNEFQGSTDSNDAKRIANGSLSKVFDPTDALPVLEAADYFGHTVNDALNGHSYNMAQLTASILKSDGKTPITANMPTADFLTNSIESGYYTTASTTSATTVKIATDDSTHLMDAGAADTTFVFYKHTGDTTLQHFDHGDLLDISGKIYASAPQALSHVTYHNGDAALTLDDGSKLTLTGIGDHALTAADFHIF